MGPGALPHAMFCWKHPGSHARGKIIRFCRGLLWVSYMTLVGRGLSGMGPLVEFHSKNPHSRVVLSDQPFIKVAGPIQNVCFSYYSKSCDAFLCYSIYL